MFGHGQNMNLANWSLDSKVDSTSRMESTDFLHVGTNSRKLKDDWKFLGLTWSKMDVAILVVGLLNWLYLKNEQKE